MLNTLNFKHIYYFWVVASEGSISKASTKTNISSSSISEQIKILEGRLGVDLFERSGKNLTLSPYGEQVYNEINPFFYSTEEIFESIVNHKKTNVKFLRIGVAPGIPEEERYYLTYPYVEDINFTVRLIQGENSYLKKAYEAGEIDMILSLNNNLLPKNQAERFTLKTEDHIFVCTKKFQKQLDEGSFPKNVHRKRFINYTTDSDLHFLLYNFFNPLDVVPLRIAEIDDIFIIKKLVLESLGFALLPLHSIEKEVKSGKLHVLHRSKKFSLPLIYYYKKSFKEERFENHLKNLV